MPGQAQNINRRLQATARRLQFGVSSLCHHFVLSSSPFSRLFVIALSPLVYSKKTDVCAIIYLAIG